MAKSRTDTEATVNITDAAIEEHRHFLFRFALLQLRDSHVTEDVVQETLLAALENKASFSGKSSVKTWLTAILKNKIVDHLRRHARQAPLPDQVESEGLDTAEYEALFDERGHWAQPPANWGDPAEALEQKAFWEVFETCVDVMPPTAARVFMLREFLGMGTEEICKDLSISPSNCWVLLYRARMSLRQCLGKKWLGRT